MKGAWGERLPVPLTVIVLVLALAPFLVLGPFAHPSSDDFCAANQMRALGFWESQRAWYFQWTGRFTAAAMMNIGPLSFGRLGLYQAVGVVLIAGLGLAFFWLAREVFRGHMSLRRSGLIALGFLVFYLNMMASPAEGIYWYTGAIIFTWGAILAMLAMAAGLRGVRSERGVAAWSWMSLSALLGMLAVGSNEIVLLFLGLVLSGLVWSSWRVDGRAPRHWLLTLTVVAIAGAAEVLAPGNFRRAEATSGASGSVAGFVGPLIGSAAFSVASVLEWLSQGPMIIGLLTTLLVGASASMSPDSSRRAPRWWLLALTTLGAVWGAFLFTHWASGFAFRPGPPHRVSNVVLLFFLMGMFATAFLAGAQVVRGEIAAAELRRAAVPWVLLAATALLFGRGNVRDAYTDLVTGRAARYDHELRERYLALEAARVRGDTAVVPQLSRRPGTIFFRDIEADPNDWRNRCYAVYWGIPAVRLGNPLPAKP